MKKTNLLFIFLFISILACTPDEPVIDFQCSDNQDVCDLARSNNSFGLDIFTKLHEADPESNLFISPFSISTAFGMLLNGSKTETKEEILEVMYLNGWTEEDLNLAFKSLMEVLPALDRKVKLNIANSIWYKENYVVLEDFIQKNKENFSSEVREIDFLDPESVEIVNQWIEDETEGKIKDMIQQFDPNTVMLLINAIYFYGEWLNEFDEDETSKKLFYLKGVQSVMCDMMHMEGANLPYYSGNQYQMIDLPYGDSIFSMTIVLPNANNSVDELLTENNISEIANNFGLMQSTDITALSLPKFKFEYKESLVETLEKLGVKKVFIPGIADLSGINGKRDLYVNEVLHQSFIEVNEKGSEAAAATVIVVLDSSVGEEAQFIANRPFVFFIRDNRTNSVLFTGKLMDPTAD